MLGFEIKVFLVKIRFYFICVVVQGAFPDIKLHFTVAITV